MSVTYTSDVANLLRLNSIVSSLMNILSSFHPHVGPNLYDCLIFERILVEKQLLDKEKVIEKFLKIYSIMFHRRKRVVQVSNDTRGRK